MGHDDAPANATERRIALLENFLGKLREINRLEDADRHANWTEIRAQQADIQSEVNRLLVAAQQAVREAGVSTVAVIAPPPVIRAPARRLDLFDNIFKEIYGTRHVYDVIECVERALGVYEMKRIDPDLVQVKSNEVVDVLEAIERALRPAFTAPPQKEKEVQAVIATILRAQGVNFHKEKERAPVGPTSFIPDFTVEDMDLAIEVKLAKPGHGEAATQRELAEDVAGYRTKWRHIIFVIYDNGVVSDPAAMKRENSKHFGVSVLIIKH